MKFLSCVIRAKYEADSHSGCSRAPWRAKHLVQTNRAGQSPKSLIGELNASEVVLRTHSLFELTAPHCLKVVPTSVCLVPTEA